MADEEEETQAVEKHKVTRMSSPSSSDSSDSEDEEQDAAYIQSLEESISQNPYNYDVHVEYINALRKASNVDKLRSAREAMNSFFPLNPKMWQDWAKDESCLDTSENSVFNIEALYEKGINEYLSVPLWIDYLNFIQEHDESVSQCTPQGIENMRSLFERALAPAGLHVQDGGSLWRLYREFEQALLIVMDERDDEVKAKQVDKIRILFQRQLSVPLADHESTFDEYRLWEEQQGINIGNESDNFSGLPANVLAAYTKAKNMYNARIGFEEKVAKGRTADAELFQDYMCYINYEESSGDPARVQLLYERAVTELPVANDLWSSYTDYLDNNLKVAGIIKSVYARAVRNCPWVESFWAKYLLALERFNASEEEISSVFEQSLQCSFSNPSEYLDLFLHRIDGLRRQIVKAKQDFNVSQFSTLKQTFLRAAEYLGTSSELTEELLHLYKYYSRLEYQLAKDLPAARNVWESLIKTRGMAAKVWLSYIDMEVSQGNITEARAIYRRCYSKRFSENGSEVICESWLRFEREYGSIDDLELAMKKVAPRLKEIKSFESQEAIKQYNRTQDVSGTLNQGKSVSLGKSSSQSNRPNVSKKRKAGLGYSERNVKPKHQKEPQGNADAAKHDAKEIGSHNLKNAGELATAEMSHGADTQTGDAELSTKPFYTDQCTAFVSNLSLEVKEQDLHKHFADTGGVQAIRLLKDRFSGRSRGLAYIDFENEEKLSAALAKNKTPLLGKKISIARSNPKEGQKKREAREQTRKQTSKPQGGHHKNSSDEEHQKASHRPPGRLQLSGSSTFAVPRMVARKLKSDTQADETPKTNEEFRKLLTKSQI